MPLYIGPWQEMKLARMIASCQRRQQAINNTSRFPRHAKVEHSCRPTKAHFKRSHHNAAIQCKSETSIAPLRMKPKVQEPQIQNDLRERWELHRRAKLDVNSKASVRCFENYDIRLSWNSDKLGKGKKYSSSTPSSYNTGKKERIGQRKKSQQNQMERVNQMRQIYMNSSASEQLYESKGSKATECIKENCPLPPKQIHSKSLSASREYLETFDMVKSMNTSSDAKNSIENVDQLILWAHSLSFEGL